MVLQRPQLNTPLLMQRIGNECWKGFSPPDCRAPAGPIKQTDPLLVPASLWCLSIRSFTSTLVWLFIDGSVKSGPSGIGMTHSTLTIQFKGQFCVFFFLYNQRCSSISFILLSETPHWLADCALVLSLWQSVRHLWWIPFKMIHLILCHFHPFIHNNICSWMKCQKP